MGYNECKNLIFSKKKKKLDINIRNAHGVKWKSGIYGRNYSFFSDHINFPLVI